MSSQKKKIFFSSFLALLIAFSFFFFSEKSFAQEKISKEVRGAAATEAAKNQTNASTPSGKSNPAPSGGREIGGDGCSLVNLPCIAFQVILYGLLKFCVLLASLAGYLFSLVIDVPLFKSLMTNPVVYEIWKLVRDFFNIFFILVLLLAAFATIFQVDKYSVKGGALKKIVLAALFINFSYPIALAIIDFGNVMLYSLVNDVFGVKDASGDVLGVSGIADIFFPKGFDRSVGFGTYFLSIVCMFLFATSFLTLSVLMLVRLVMLPILVMFSPVGFAASAFPGMGKFSSDWWNMLIKYTFYGPIAMFMILIALKFLQTFEGLKKSGVGVGGAFYTSSTGFLSTLVYFTIPIIFMWIAITTAEKLSSQTAGFAGDWGKKARQKLQAWGKKGGMGALGWTGRTIGVTGTYENAKAGMKNWWDRDGFVAKRTARLRQGGFNAYRAKQEELKKYDDEVNKQRSEDLGKPGKNAARDEMDKKDKELIAKGGEVGKVAQKRYNDRKRTANNEDIKKKKEELENSGMSNDAGALLTRMNEIDAKGVTATKEEQIERAALASHLIKAKAGMSRDAQEEFLEKHSSVNAMVNKEYKDIFGDRPDPSLPGGTEKAKEYDRKKQEYEDLRNKAKAARARLQSPNPMSVYTGSKEDRDKKMKSDRVAIEQFLSYKTKTGIQGGSDFDTDTTNFSSSTP